MGEIGANEGPLPASPGKCWETVRVRADLLYGYSMNDNTITRQDIVELATETHLTLPELEYMLGSASADELECYRQIEAAVASRASSLGAD